MDAAALPGVLALRRAGALKELAEAGLLDDPRCQDGLALLAAKQLPGGGWAAEAKHYRVTDAAGSGVDYVGWGGVDHHRINEWVTTDALAVLTAASRLDG